MTVRYCVYRDPAGAIDYLVSASSKGHGRNGHIAEGSCFSRNVALDIGSHQITVNEGSVIDFINANRKCGLKTKRKLHKGFLCFGPTEAKIQKRFSETVRHLSHLPQGAKNCFQSQEWGFAQGKLDFAAGEYQTAYERLKNVRDPRGIALRNIIASGTDIAQDLYRFAEYLSGCISHDSAERQENLEIGFEYYRLAAQAGSIDACLKVSRCLKTGIGTPVDPAQAEQAEAAAEQLKTTPEPVVQAPALFPKPSKATTHFFKSVKWHYKRGKAAFEAKDYSAACTYLEGATSDKRAKRLLEILNNRTATSPHEELLFEFGHKSLKKEEAFRGYRLAAEAGNIRSYSMLANCFKNGIGTPQDLARANDMQNRFDYLVYHHRSCTSSTSTNLSMTEIQAQGEKWPHTWAEFEAKAHAYALEVNMRYEKLLLEQQELNLELQKLQEKLLDATT